MPTASPLGSGFPQSGNNRARGDAITELTDYMRLSDDPDACTRGGRAWEAAIREYNTVLWLFNRQTVDITFSDSVTDGQYDLPANFKKPERAILLDVAGKEVRPLEFVPFEDKVWLFTDESTTGTRPILYTGFNIHDAGKVRYWQIPIGATQFPKARHIYFSEIVVPKDDTNKLAVPIEVDEAIFQLAVAKFVHAESGARRAETDYTLADRIRAVVSKTWVGYVDVRGR